MFASLPTGPQCQTVAAVLCYTPQQLRHAYGVGQLPLDGTGTTIAVIVSYGSPTITADLATFDRTFGLPDPPSLTVINPAGTPPAFDPSDAQQGGWAYETSLDVEYAHVMAPRARLLVVATPVAETSGVQGFPEMMSALRYLVDHRLATVVSQSFAASESTFPDRSAVTALRTAYESAAAARISVLAAAGDTGPTGYESDLATLSPHRTTGWPASDPLVTAVGGTSLQLGNDGMRTTADTVWQDAYGAGGGGTSTLFPRPDYQDAVAAIVGPHRGTPDIAMSAGVDGGVLVYTSYDAADTGWSIVGGTSESTPLFAGLVALAAQQAGHPLGNLNPALYRLGAHGIVDITEGDNSFGGVEGFSAGAGYDLASGLGSIDAATFVPALARESQRLN